jgi:hypothetical protein
VKGRGEGREGEGGGWEGREGDVAYSFQGGWTPLLRPTVDSPSGFRTLVGPTSGARSGK